MSGKVYFDGNGDKQFVFWVEDLKNISDEIRFVGIIEMYKDFKV